MQTKRTQSTLLPILGRRNALLGREISVSIIISLLILAIHYQNASSMPVLNNELEGKTRSDETEQQDAAGDQMNIGEGMSAQLKMKPAFDPQDYVSDDVPFHQVLRAAYFSRNNSSNTRHDAVTNSIKSSEELTTTTTTTTTSTRSPFVETDEEFNHLIDELSEDAVDSVSHPLNYVKDDDDLERIVNIIKDGEVEKLHERWVKNRDLFAQEDECPICREEFDGKEEEYKLPCEHLFHKKCMDDWLKNGNSCPVCRQRVSESPEPTIEQVQPVQPVQQQERRNRYPGRARNQQFFNFLGSLPIYLIRMLGPRV